MTRVSVHDLSKHRETRRDGVVATIQDLFHRGKSVMAPSIVEVNEPPTGFPMNNEIC